MLSKVGLLWSLIPHVLARGCRIILIGHISKGGSKMGFSLGIINAPAGSTLWHADFAENSFDYDPLADSGWLPPDREWSYPSDPRGVTTLRIQILDADNNILLDVENLGPIDNRTGYIYDCSTGMLEAFPQAKISPVLALGIVGALSLGIIMKKAKAK